ncbi:MAG: alpha/beta hydrolase [Ruminococcaceae bacterium]|nr:alpha/beta hydrolase [Oscillospiraceae bacterium]
MILLYILLAIVFVVLATSLVCFFKIFYSPRKKWPEYPVPAGEIYQPHHEQMIKWIKEARELPHTEVRIKSHDGLTLVGTYYEFQKGAPIDVLFHGYHGCAEQDLSGGVYRCQRLGHNVLIVDHRGAGKSEGHVVTFGINESRDALAWVQYVVENIDPNAKILLGGISMGAATVMMASAMELPKNVVGTVADCGYTSAKEIIKKVIREMHLPADLLYPFVRLGARLFGRFDPDENSPIVSMPNCRVPVIFFHGDTDAFVPQSMSEENFAACAAPKHLVITPGAGHGLCFPVDVDTYVKEIEEFFEPYLEEKTNQS